MEHCDSFRTCSGTRQQCTERARAFLKQRAHQRRLHVSATPGSPGRCRACCTTKRRRSRLHNCCTGGSCCTRPEVDRCDEWHGHWGHQHREPTTCQGDASVGDSRGGQRRLRNRQACSRGDLRAHEVALAQEKGLEASRGALAAYYMTDEGLSHLCRMLETGAYKVRPFTAKDMHFVANDRCPKFLPLPCSAF